MVNSSFLQLKLLEKVKRFSEFESDMHAFISFLLDLQSLQITVLRAQRG